MLCLRWCCARFLHEPAQSTTWKLAGVEGWSSALAVAAATTTITTTTTAPALLPGGREDADVRMLGSGRPFVLEITNPKAGHPPEAELRALEAALAAADRCGVAPALLGAYAARACRVCPGSVSANFMQNARCCPLLSWLLLLLGRMVVVIIVAHGGGGGGDMFLVVVVVVMVVVVMVAELCGCAACLGFLKPCTESCWRLFCTAQWRAGDVPTALWQGCAGAAGEHTMRLS